MDESLMHPESLIFDDDYRNQGQLSKWFPKALMKKEIWIVHTRNMLKIMWIQKHNHWL